MVAPIGLAGSSRLQQRSVQSPKFGNTPPTPPVPATPSETQGCCGGAGHEHHEQPTGPAAVKPTSTSTTASRIGQMVQSLFSATRNGFASLTSFLSSLSSTTGETQAGESDPTTKFLNSEVESLSKEKKIALSVLTENQKAKYQKALNEAKEFLNNGDEVDLPAIVEHLLKVRQDISSSATAGEAAAPQSPATGGQAASTPQGTPENGDAAAPSGEQSVQGATGPSAVSDAPAPEEPKQPAANNNTEAAKKEEQNWKNGYIGWKAGIGAALLAGGIALKMTIIGIVPGLIMAGVGTALMGWGGINWLSKDKKD